MTVCPCCGFKFEGDLQHDGCAACGARAVGPPLSKPMEELPFYGRALFISALGGIMLATFLVASLVALLESQPVSFGFWNLISAGETAAWRLKWLALPVAILAVWSGLLICRSIRRNPRRFGGRRLAHGGLMAASAVTISVAILVGITIPERLRQRQRSLDAAAYAQGYTIQRALLEYRSRYQTLPSSLDDLRKLPDPDGSLSSALAEIDASAYSPSADVASLSKKRPRSLRGAALRNASSSSRASSDALEGGLSFTKYEMRLPGPDKLVGTEDDLIMRNGLITSQLEAERQPSEARDSNFNKP